ncbi:MAG: polysaccharide biosynthesis C-terminal domain-containing protein [Lachnospirales bacterium]
MGSKNKKSGGSFVKQAAILASAGIIVRFIGFLYRLPLTNMIGDSGNGIYAAGYNIYNFFLIMSSAGLPVAISKMVAEKVALGEYKNAKKIFNVSMTVSGGISFFFGLLMVVGAFLFKNYCQGLTEISDNLNLWYKSVWCLYTLSPTIFIVGIMAVFRGYFQGLNTTVPTAVSQIVEQVFNAVFSVYLAWLLIDLGVEFGAAGGTAGTGVGALGGLLVLVYVFFKTKKERAKIFSADKGGYKVDSFGKISKTLVRIAIPIITGTAIFSMTNLVDMFMVNDRLAAAGFSGKVIEELYGQLNGKYVTLSTMPVAISTAIATAVIPSIAASVVKKEKKLVQTKVDTALRITMLISLPAAAGLGALGSPILKMLFPSYPDGGILIQVGSLSVIFLALSQISTGVLQGIGKVSTPAKNALIGALTKIPVNYFLIAIPEINVVGAVISTTVCYIVCSILNFRALVKATGVKPDYVGMLVKPAVASGIMAVFTIISYNALYKFINNNTICTLIALVVAIIIYFAAMVLIKGFRREDLQNIPMGTKVIRFLEKINRID